MMLSDTDIRLALERHEIDVQPHSDAWIGPASLDVHLGSSILLPQRDEFGEPIFIDPSRENDGAFKSAALPAYEAGARFYLRPGQALLGSTLERVALNSRTIAADISGCSGLARWFLLVHVTAGFIDPGWGKDFAAPLTVELVNVGPFAVRLWAYMRLGQIRYWRTQSAVQMMYNERRTSEYKGARDVQASHYHEAYKGK